MDTDTKPMPVITIQPSGSDPVAHRRHHRHPVAVASLIGAAVIVLALIVMNWQAIVTALFVALLVGVLALVLACVLFRIATGGRLGPVIVGAIAAAILVRRRR